MKVAQLSSDGKTASLMDMACQLQQRVQQAAVEGVGSKNSAEVKVRLFSGFLGFTRHFLASKNHLL